MSRIKNDNQTFFKKNLRGKEIGCTFAVALGNGGIAQSVRASDS